VTEKQLKIWQALNDYQFDDPEAEFSFTDRLARENGWDFDYALRATDEYKKFIFADQLNKIQKAAVQNENIFEHLMEASKYCSLGQITDALFEVGGQYRRNI
jgi:methylmalonyl-CoA mutase N-terminal domain/subunit